MRRTIRGAAWVAVTAALATACSSGGGGSPAAPAQSVRAPYLVMSSPDAGLLVWAAGHDWLVLSTSDGFTHVTNATPGAVDTEGGLSAAVDGGSAVVAVGATDRLLRSPVLIARSHLRWQPSEPPGAITTSTGSVAVTATTAYAVLSGHGGTLVRRESAADWTTVTDGVRLSHDLTLDSVAWSGADGIVAGHGAAGAAMAYRTGDNGSSWQPVPGTAGHSVRALSPCGDAAHWEVPVVDAAGTLRVVPAEGVAGDPVSVGTGAVAFGCSGADMLVLDDHGVVQVSHDAGQHWHAGGTAPAALTSLAPTGSGSGFATSGGDKPTLWRLSSGDTRFTRVPLPPWVAQLGGQGGTS